MAEDVGTIYARRFQGIEIRRDQVWQVLSGYFQRWVKLSDTVLDVGAGYCEFINSIQARERCAIDLNPITSSKASPGVQVISQNICDKWRVDSDSVDFVFSSNFFEHLPSKEELKHCLNEIKRVLRPGGILLAMGPNIRFCCNVYWDFFDHYLPLSDRSMTEVLEITGFLVEQVTPRFLPYTMARTRPPSPIFVRLYLRMPILWPFFGKQFLILARKPNASAA
jgi:dolichol-phosphate mannosyltransferase